MTPPDNRKRILVVSLKKEAEPVLRQLRAAGHQVSVVQDMDDAQALLASGAFDQTILPARTIESLLVQRALWERSGGDSWHRSTAAIAHDLRNLLSALGRCTRDLEAEDFGTPRGGDLPQLQRTMSILSTFLLELTDEFDAGPRQDLSLRVLDLEDAVETAAIAVYSSASDRRQRLVIDIDERARYIRADSTKMKRVLSNLLLHASGQTPRLGTVTVLARRECEDCIISVSHTAETASLSGLTELLGAKDRGDHAGGGLYGVQHIVEQHGGRLWIESERGAGTTIFVSFPSPEIDYSESTLSVAPG